LQMLWCCSCSVAAGCDVSSGSSYLVMHKITPVVRCMQSEHCLWLPC
jgi:hypothetical protein